MIKLDSSRYGKYYSFKQKALFVNIIAVRTLRLFWQQHPQSEKPLRVLYNRLTLREWSGPQDIKEAFCANVDFIGGNRVIFDVAGNKYRVVIAFAYAYKRGMVKFVGTHSEYDKINAETV